MPLSPVLSRGQRRNWVVERFTGLDNHNDPQEIDEAYSPDTLNTVLDTVGSIQSRKGYIKLLTTSLAGPILGIKEFYKSDGVTKQLIYASGSTLYKYNNAGGSTALTNNGSAISFTANKQWDFDVYADKLFGVNGADGLIQYDFTNVQSLSLAVGGITPTNIRVHKNRVWVAQGSTLYFSDAGNPTSFPVANFINVNTNDGQTITGLDVLLDSLVVFKTDSIWIITGEPSGSGNSTVLGNLNLRRANSDVGCVAFRTIRRVGSVILFMSRSGIYVFENAQTRLISENINATFAQMNQSFQNLSWGIYSPSDKKYLVGYADGGSATPNKVICYDMIVKQFTIWDDVPGSCAALFRFTPADTVVLGDPSKGNIYELFQGYADIAGANGTATGGSATTLVDSTANWTTNQFVDCRVQVTSGGAAGTTGTVTANTTTTLSVASWSNGSPTSGSVYTIGGYTSYWKTKVFDFGVPQLSKRYKYFNIFTDSEGAYSLQSGLALDYAPLSFNQPSVSLLAPGSSLWDQVGVAWDQVGIYWDTRSGLFKRLNVPGPQGRVIQAMFGNYNANQPWRVIRISMTFKGKKERPSS